MDISSRGRLSRRKLLGTAAALAATVTVRQPAALAQTPVYSFGVLNQRSVPLIAQYWNPILTYVSMRTGVSLELKVGRTAPETTAMALRQELDFTYTNHLFSPDRLALGYRVIARPDTEGIRGQINVLADSPLRTLSDLAGKEVGFPSKESFVGYQVPMDALIKAGVTVHPVFAGNQEGTIGQLRAGRIQAACNNSQFVRGFAAREGLAYRTVWESEPFLDIPVMVHQRTPSAVAAAVRDALAGMMGDPAGAAVLTEVSTVWGIATPIGFVRAADDDYETYRRFYRDLSPALAEGR